MIDLNLSLGNEEASAFKRELRAFIDSRLLPKLTGKKNDRRDTATSAYVVAKRIIARIDEHEEKLRTPKEGKRGGPKTK